MEKKDISIIGTCCSRNLFNSEIMKRIFNVKFYGFQCSMFNMVDENLNSVEGLGIDKSIIYKAKTPEFTARTYHQELNKTIISEVKNANSEYLLLDLNTIASDIVKVSYNGKFVYTQSTAYRILNFKNNIINDNITELESMTFEVIKFENFDKSILENGLKNLILWAKNNFDEDKIIINEIQLAKKYLKNNEIKSYPEEELNKISLIQNHLDYFQSKIRQWIPNAKFLNDNLSAGGNIVAVFDLFDDNTHKYPPRDHFSILNLNRKSQNLLNQLKIDYRNYLYDYEKDFIQSFDDLDFLLFCEQLIDLNFKLNNTKKSILNLNSYFDKMENINDWIIVISSKDEASSQIKYFRRKNLLEIDMNINFGDSYIAVIDKGRDFIFEKSSQELLSYTYTLENSEKIEVISSGFNSGSYSSIKVNGEEYSLNKQGLNFLILNSHTCEVVDFFSCDSYQDKELTISSYYFNNQKLKI